MNDNERYIVDNYFGFESKQLLIWTVVQKVSVLIVISAFFLNNKNHKVIIINKTMA